ncbi:MAG TPA: hypothetical protein ENJ27_00590 [Candidatus Moranbacteria bacterium]|nr:hypothetical protein [Candidatus Moranbacteria bacterium]
MKNKSKKYIYRFLSLCIITIPMTVLAQWNVGSINSSANLPNGTVAGIITNIMLWLLAIVGIIGVIGFVIAGILYLTAAGDDDQMEKGKKAMTWSIVGVIVALMGYVIIQAVNTMLGGTSAVF